MLCLSLHAMLTFSRLASIALRMLPDIPLADAGRRVGEQCESFWALAKPLSRIARYMGPYNHVDFLDDAFGRIAAKKLWSFPDMMAQQTKAVLKKLGASWPAWR